MNDLQKKDQMSENQQILDSTPPCDYGKTLHKDVFAYVPVKIIPAVVTLVTILILTRYLTPEQYGIYSVVLTTSLLMLQLCGSWIANAVLFVYPDYYPEHASEFEQTTVVYQLVVAVPAALIGFAVLLLITHDSVLALLGAVITTLQLFQTLLMTFKQSVRKVKEQAIAIGLQYIMQLFLICVLVIAMQGKQASALLAVAIGFAVGTVALIWVGTSPLRREAVSALPPKELLRRLTSYGLPMCIWFFATQFYSTGDRLLLQWMGVTSALGQYASFRDLAVGCAGFLTMPLLMASHPIIMAMWKQGADREDIEKLMAKNIVLLTMLFVPLLVMVDMCGVELVTRLLGAKYLLDKNVMLLVVGSVYLACLTMYVQKGLEVTGQTMLLAKIAVLAVVISLVGNLLSIRSYGVHGAAGVVLLAQMSYLLMVRYATAHILAPRVPRSLLVKLVIWVVLVEMLCRSLGVFTWSAETFLVSPYFRFVIIVFAAGLLFLNYGKLSLARNSLVKDFRC